ncbi:MAG: reactivating factor for ethanolamine ammonia lyase [Rhizobiales bacterium]|nr:reactivating factor for ethanolamine ammonia lyase [Hyphomicrobiales bacterium]
MHDLEFEHLHVTDDDTREINEAAWFADNVELTTVGIDIGSSTSHLMFARVHLQRLSSALSSRFVVIDRRLLWQSPILLTPYLPDYTIDTGKLAEFISGAYADAGLARGDVDSGAVILTGEALKRKNARAIADLFSEEAGKFVCASAGHHMECQMAAHGSGAVALSRSRGVTVLNVDIGGGTTKFALVQRGQVLATAAIAVGGRLVVEEAGQGIVRLEPPAVDIARSIGIDLKPGGTLSHRDRHDLADRMTDLIVAMIERRPPDALAASLLVTDPVPEAMRDIPIDAVTFSGGVAEYLYGREQARYGDLGSDLAHSLRHAIADKRVSLPVWDAGQGIRATVIGAAQFSVQVSGNTIAVTDPAKLPLQNLPVIACAFDLAGAIDADAVAATVRRALEQCDIEEGAGAVALAFPWHGDPLHRRMHAVAEGICAALPRSRAAGLPLVLLIDGDIGMSLGRVIRHEVAPGVDVIAIDGVQLKQFDYVDIGRMIEVTNVVPIIIKSLLFK